MIYSIFFFVYISYLRIWFIFATVSLSRFTFLGWNSNKRPLRYFETCRNIPKYWSWFPMWTSAAIATCSFFTWWFYLQKRYVHMTLVWYFFFVVVRNKWEAYAHFKYCDTLVYSTFWSKNLIAQGGLSFLRGEKEKNPFFIRLKKKILFLPY